MTCKASARWAFFLVLLSSLSPDGARGQSPFVQLAAKTPLAVRIPTHLPMRAGEPIRAELLYPVYAGTVLVLPEKTVVTGSVIALRPDRTERIRARFNLDFTPFHLPVVRFNQITLPNGTSLPLVTDIAADGAPMVRLLAAKPRKKQNFLHKEYDATVHLVHDDIVFVTAPGRGDRLLQLFYHQLPWHPQRIETGTAWTVETAEPLRVPVEAAAVSPMIAARPPRDPADWTIQADLEQSLSSATAKPGEAVEASVAEPVFNADHSLAIPEGAILTGTVTQDRPSRRFGRAGSLRFGFSQIILPSGERQSLAANVAGVDAGSEQKLALDSEGEVKPEPQDKVIVPALLLGLASAPLDPDPGDNDEFFKNAGASNSLGAMGFVTGIAVNRAAVSAGFGYYGAALSISSRWIQHGPEVTFPRGTRIVLQATGRDAKPAAR